MSVCCIVDVFQSAKLPVMTFPGAFRNILKTGWMNQEFFMGVLKHFLMHAMSSKDNPLLLNMDNHGSEILSECKNL